MTDFSRIKKNTFYSIITISSRLIANVFLFWLLARFYGPKIFGQFTFAHTLATTFIVFADFGIEIILTTKLAAEKGNSSKVFEKLLGLKLVFLVIALVLMIAIGLTFDLNEDAYKLLFIFSIYLLFTSLNNFFAGVFKGYEKFIYETRVSILANFILILFTIILLILHRSIIEIAIAFAASRVIGTIYSVYNLWLVDKNLTFKADLSGFKLLGGKVLIFGFHLIFSYLFFHIDTLLISKFK
jgi:O-antigen/teichoic acid export membrane protein